MKPDSGFLGFVQACAVKPALFEPGQPQFWNDPHISGSMLAAHLNPGHDAASRKPETIDKTIQHWFDTGLLKPGMKLLDLGCGPGLYAERLGKAGVSVVGLDLSERSIAYAKKHAAESAVAVEYHCMDFFAMEYADEFDAVIQVYGELCTFAAEKRDALLQSVHRALKPDGVFIFDVSTRALRLREGAKNAWQVRDGGFWRPGRHLVLEQGFDYPAEETWLDQYIVADDQGCEVYRNWFHDYSLDSINAVLSANGFKTTYVWNDLTGSIYAEGGDWIAVAATRLAPTQVNVAPQEGAA